MAAAKEVSMDVALAAVLSELNNISSLREEQRKALKAFLGGKNVFAFLFFQNNLSFSKVVYGLFPRWACGVYPIDM